MPSGLFRYLQIMLEEVSVFAFFGSNTDGSLTTAVSTFLSPLEKSNSCRLRMKFILIENDIPLESPQGDVSNDNTQNTFMLKKSSRYPYYAS